MGIATELSFRLESLEVDEPWIVEQMNFDTLVQYLQPSSSISPTAAAQSIDSLTPMKRTFIGTSFGTKEEPESHMWEIWGLLVAVSKQVPPMSIRLWSAWLLWSMHWPSYLLRL